MRQENNAPRVSAKKWGDRSEDGDSSDDGPESFHDEGALDGRADRADPDDYADHILSHTCQTKHTSTVNTTIEYTKQMMGETLFPLIHNIEPYNAAKITGMFLEIDIDDLRRLTNSPDELLRKIKEAKSNLEKTRDPSQVDQTLSIKTHKGAVDDTMEEALKEPRVCADIETTTRKELETTLEKTISISKVSAVQEETNRKVQADLDQLVYNSRNEVPTHEMDNGHYNRQKRWDKYTLQDAEIKRMRAITSTLNKKLEGQEKVLIIQMKTEAHNDENKLKRDHAEWVACTSQELSKKMRS